VTSPVAHIHDASLRAVLEERSSPMELHGNTFAPVCEQPLKFAEMAIYDRVIEFVRLETRAGAELSSETDIARDLGVDGDDAREFMIEFHRQFDVDLSKFEFDRHFGSEGFKLTAAIKSALGRGERKVPVTIGLLCVAAETRQWPSYPSGGE
jgi:hypothetical protein